MGDLQVTQIKYHHSEDPELRSLKLTLSNGTEVTAESCLESWQQWGGTEDELWSTRAIVEAHNDWLHGGELPFGGE